MGECVLCREVVTNPVCPECLQDEMRTWIGETMPKFVAEFDRISLELDPSMDHEETCIICKNGMDICVYCYTEHVFNWLLQKNIERALLAEFLIYFDFDADKKGYVFRAEKLGIRT